MTNNWADIGNATLVVAMGANPSENHPACMAHINNARKGPHTWTDRGFGTSGQPGYIAPVTHTTAKPAAKLVVIDPRKTRTALQADMYVRIRPGTDIAFINALIRYVMADMASRDAGTDRVRQAFDLIHTETKNNNQFMKADGAVSTSGWTSPRWSDATFKVYQGASGDARHRTDYVRDTVNGIANFPVQGALGDADSVYSALWEQVDHYDSATAAAICGCSAAEIDAVAELFIENSRCSSIPGISTGTPTSAAHIFDPKNADYRSVTMLYAMGITQHTYGSQNVKSFATIQTLLGNSGRMGGGINALRGIHNVQGSTDQGLLYHLIPGYSGNPTETRATNADAFGRYTDKLWGRKISGNAYADAYKAGTSGTLGTPGLQQVGFTNMTRMWFGGKSTSGNPWESDLAPYNASGDPRSSAECVRLDNLYDLWPKGNGDNHVMMFRRMASSDIKGCLVWGQNPAVTEPNQGSVRAGLKNLDILAVVDMFETETASVDRKAGSLTYLFPACSHVEEAGSATNSGRVLQWRYAARPPQGNSKADMENLLRFAYALEGAGGFQHIKDVWDRTEVGISTAGSYPVYTKLYGNQYGWTPPAGYAAFDSEAVAQAMYKQMCNGVYSGGTLWIYTGAYTAALGATQSSIAWTQAIRAKERNGSDAPGGATTAKNGNRLFTNWGYSWLVNRRVLYNDMAGAYGDQQDTFQTPERVARLFVPIVNTTVFPNSCIDYGHMNYRFYHGLADKSDAASNVAHTPQHRYTGRFHGHTEPYETPYDGTISGKPNYVGAYGRNTAAGVSCLPAGTPVAKAGGTGINFPTSQFPLVLTTIRCVEHFQGGPITRNNWWNVEAEPEPWIELNSVDARTYGISDGDYVRIVTARTEAFAGDTIAASFPRALYGSGFRARVGTGLPSDQRVGSGVVAIPWHWGDRGLSTGSRANDLCIDAWDANTTIPEYKACLCRIEKI